MAHTVDTGIPGFFIRPAVEADCPMILHFIRSLAEYEKMEDQVIATEQGLREAIFVNREAEVIIGEENGVPVGFALYFTNFSTFVGRSNLYLEDIFVLESHRGKGYGEALLRALAAIAVGRGCKRVDWWCLNWNKSAAAFYHRMGAVPQSEWTTFRLEGESLLRCAGQGIPCASPDPLP